VNGCWTNCWLPSEQADFAKAPDKGRFLAKRFAAKEAFAKALGTGIRPPATADGHRRTATTIWASRSLNATVSSKKWSKSKT
jgi:phosphopantetheine--protein transferase-like protein